MIYGIYINARLKPYTDVSLMNVVFRIYITQTLLFIGVAFHVHIYSCTFLKAIVCKLKIDTSERGPRMSIDI